MEPSSQAITLPNADWQRRPMTRQTISRPVPERASLHYVGEFSDIDVTWIWPGYVPRNNLTLLAGPPGIGKSFLALDIAARLTANLPWPGSSAEANVRPTGTSPVNSFPPVRGRNVLLVTGEENCLSVVASRFLAAGGIDGRLIAIDEIYGRDLNLVDGQVEFEDRFTLDRDLHHLESLLYEWENVGLIIIDPIAGHCDGAESEAYLQRQLSLLVRLAFRHEAAVLAISHLRGDPAKTDVYKVLGSRALASVPRTIWTVQCDPDDSRRRLMLPLKMNLGPPPPGLAFRFGARRLEWESEPIHRMASDPPLSERQAVLSSEAVEFLRHALADGDLPAAEILKLGRELGFSSRTMYRAKSLLKVRSNRIGFGPSATYQWSSPSSPKPGEASSGEEKSQSVGNPWEGDGAVDCPAMS